MEAKKFLEADYLDIVFENRNKAYGSYELRKNYARRVKKAGLFALIGVVSVASLSFVASIHNSKAKPDAGYVITTTKIDLPTQPPPQTLRPTTPPPPPPSQPTKSFTLPKITPDEVVIDKPMTPVNELTNVTPGVSNLKGDSLAWGSGPVSGDGPTRVIPTTTTPNEPVVFVEQMPQFNGDLDKYLSDNIRYPDNARNAGAQGRVIIQFVVNEDGSVNSLKMVHGIGSGCDEEAMRVVKAMPKWKPGKNNGTAVKVFYTQAIFFKLD